MTGLYSVSAGAFLAYYIRGVVFISLYNIAVVNSRKLLNNIEIIKNVARCDKICAVVKADAYGHGAVGIASIAEPYVDYFAVALVEEGVELRLSGIEKPILVLIPVDYESIERAVLYDLTLTVDCITDAIKINDVCKKNSLSAKVHLKVDTGMHRLGFRVEDAEKICSIISRLKNVCVTGCYSHFADPECISRTEKQFAEFMIARERVKKFFPSCIFHIAASGGISNSSRYSLDMVRPGLLMYGYKPFKSDVAPVQPILRIYGKVIKERSLDKGEGILYGNYKLAGECKIAIVRAGYADGLRRREIDTINNKCMDMCAVKNDKNADYICVFENADIVSDKERTISYEVLCSLTKRSRIIYED